MTLDKSKRALKFGAYAALFQSAITFLVVSVAIKSDASGRLGQFNDPLNYLDVVVLLVCSFGMFRRSRTLAIVAFLEVVVGYFFLEGQGRPGRILASLFFGYVYIQAALGAFAFHKNEKSTNPDYKPLSLWVVVPTSVFGVVVAGLIGLTALIELGLINSTRIEIGSALDKNTRDELILNGIIYQSETVEQFYFLGFVSPLVEGVLLTNNGIVYYYQELDDSVQVFEMLFSEILEIEPLSIGGVLDDAVYEVKGIDPGTWMRIPLSTENNGDRKFVLAVRRKIKEFSATP